MGFDGALVRTAYPALADGHAYLDGAAGTQVPSAVIDAISAAYRAGIGNVGGTFAASARSTGIVAECRRAVADLVGGAPEGVVLGPNMTTLTYRFAGTLAKQWGPGDEVVVSRLDHDANVRPWIQAARRAGASVRWAEVDPATGELPVAQYEHLVSERTRLVAVTAASNVLGTRPDVPAVAAFAHAAGALVYVDGVHATAHGPVDVAELGADCYATSAYKWSGPHVGALVADPGLLARLHPDKLASSPDTTPERYETGTLPFADLAGVVAAVDHLAGLDPAAAGTRRQRLIASMTAAEAHELRLFAELWDGLAGMPHVRLYGALSGAGAQRLRPAPAPGSGAGAEATDLACAAARRTATAYFTVADHTPREVAAYLAGRHVNVWHGHNYAWEVTSVLGIRDSGSAVRAGLVHYNDREDVDRLLAGVAQLQTA